MISKYFNPYTDFGFKKLFGEEASKDLLIDFLNQLLPPQHQIAAVSFKNPENMSTPSTSVNLFSIFIAKAKRGSVLLLKCKKRKCSFLKTVRCFIRLFRFRDQGKKGVWDFYLLPVYFIAILDFKYDEKEDERKFRRDVCLKDQDGDVFYHKLHFKFLQMPLFNKQEHELETHFDKWVYFLKHLEGFDHIPAILNEPIFQKGFDIAELNSDQYDAYLKSILSYNEAKAVTDTAFYDGEKKGIKKGNIEGKLETAKTMLVEGFDVATIAKITKLTVPEIEDLQ